EKGPDGKLADYRIKYTFGVSPLQQYLVEFPDGRLQALPIAWDTRPVEQGGQRWFHLYPDERITHDDELHWTKPAQNWNYMCADCHSTGYRKNYDPKNDTFDSTWTDVDVACEACHGPGSLHVARARESRLAAGSGLIADFGLEGRTRVLEDGATTLSIRGGEPRTDQVEACGRCHARRAPISAEYHHGRPLMDSYVPAPVTEPLYFPDGQIRDEVYVYGSFRQSRMYAAGVICSDCHDPHSLELKADGDAVCAQCHLPDHYDTAEHSRHAPSAGAPGCRDCHMPSRDYMVVDPRRDHSFRVPRPDLAESLGVTDACGACHGDRPAGWTTAAVREWLGRDARGLQDFGPTFAAAGRGAIGAGAGLRRISQDAGQPAIVRASALSLLAAYPGQESLSVAADALSDPDPAVRLAALGVVRSVPVPERLPLVEPLLTDPVLGVRIEAARLLAGADPGSLEPETRDRLAGALTDYVDAQRASLDRPASRLNLGNLYAAAGDAETAEAQYRAALVLDPDFEPAYGNLADLLARRGDEAGAGVVLRRGLGRVPKSASLHHANGLHRIRAGDRAGALESLARAVELAPDNTRFRYVYAVALDGQGNRSEALAQLEEAHARHAADPDVLWALISTCLRSGDVEAASRYARQLGQLRPSDPRVQDLLDQLGD
ncbi:MAG: tetratricopeptide repeat protein, partial [Gammaproteobacteria bacterium]